MSWFKVGVFAVFLLWPMDAGSHALSRSSSTWRLSDSADGHITANVIFLVPTIAAEFVPYGDPSLTASARFSRHLSENIGLSVDGAGCARESVQVRQVEVSRLRAQLRFRCGEASEATALSLRAQLSIFFDSDAGHIHFARFLWRGKTVEHLFTSNVRSHDLEMSAGGQNFQITSWDAFVSYVPIGIEHILSGLDHLAFLAALLLVCGRLRLILWAVTGFTLGHSITLGLASLDVLSADSDLIEVLIGFTVLLMALESAALAQGHLRKLCLILSLLLGGFFVLSFWVESALGPLAWAGLLMFTLCWGFFIRDHDHAARVAPFLSVLFGLIHGFGFASVLAEAGLPEGHLLTALFGFNIGVELGQLAMILVFIVVAWVLGRLLPLWRSGRVLWEELPYVAASLLVGLGTYWFVGRAVL